MRNVFETLTMARIAQKVTFFTTIYCLVFDGGRKVTPVEPSATFRNKNKEEGGFLVITSVVTFNINSLSVQ